MACNLIGCLTPLGNPQNLFIFHRSGWRAEHFIAVMTPFVIWSIAGLLAALFLLGRSRPLRTIEVDLPPRKIATAAGGAICFVLVLLEIARVVNAWPAAIAALIAGAIFLRTRLFAIDYSIVPLFFFAFIVVEGMRTALGIGARILPATDGEQRTMVRTAAGWIRFQEYFVKRRASDPAVDAGRFPVKRTLGAEHEATIIRAFRER